MSKGRAMNALAGNCIEQNWSEVAVTCGETIANLAVRRSSSAGLTATRPRSARTRAGYSSSTATCAPASKPWSESPDDPNRGPQSPVLSTSLMQSTARLLNTLS